MSRTATTVSPTVWPTAKMNQLGATRLVRSSRRPGIGFAAPAVCSRPCTHPTPSHFVLAKYSQYSPTVIRKRLGQAAVIFAPKLTQNAQQRVGGELESPSRRSQVQLVQPVLDGALEDRRPQLVLREIRVEQQPVVPNLVPLALLAPLVDAVVEARAGQRVGDGVADVVEGQAAGEVDAADQGVGGLAKVSDHEEAGRLDTGSDACLDCGAGLFGRNPFLHLLQDVGVARLDAEEDSLAAGAMHLLEQSLVHVRDAAETFPRQR